MSEQKDWEKAYRASTRIMEGTLAILDSVLQNGGDKALQGAAMAHSMDAATVLHYLSQHDPWPEDKRTSKERLADGLKATRGMADAGEAVQ
jgi:hypothetical protein